MSENYGLNQDCFDVSELVSVRPPSNPALLRSGGPILDVLDVDDEGWAHCQWDRWVNGVKKTATGAFKLVCLYRLVPFEPIQQNK